MLQKMTWIVSITHYIFNKLTGGLPTIVDGVRYNEECEKGSEPGQYVRSLSMGAGIASTFQEREEGYSSEGGNPKKSSQELNYEEFLPHLRIPS